MSILLRLAFLAKFSNFDKHALYPMWDKGFGVQITENRKNRKIGMIKESFYRR